MNYAGENQNFFSKVKRFYALNLSFSIKKYCPQKKFELDILKYDIAFNKKKLPQRA